MVCSSVEGSGNVTCQAPTDRLSPVIGWGLTNQGPRLYHQISSTNTPLIMDYLTYEDSVLGAADPDTGNLSHKDAERLLADHSFTLDDVYEDNHGVSWVALDERNAEALLAWLGY